MAGQQGERIASAKRSGDGLDDKPYDREKYLADPERIDRLNDLLEDAVMAVFQLCEENPDNRSYSTYKNGDITLDDLGDKKLGNQKLFVDFETDDTRYALLLTLDDEGEIDLRKSTYLIAYDNDTRCDKYEYIVVMSERNSICADRVTQNPETREMETMAGPWAVETVEEAEAAEHRVDVALREMLGLAQNEK